RHCPQPRLRHPSCPAARGATFAILNKRLVDAPAKLVHLIGPQTPQVGVEGARRLPFPSSLSTRSSEERKSSEVSKRRVSPRATCSSTSRSIRCQRSNQNAAWSAPTAVCCRS